MNPQIAITLSKFFSSYKQCRYTKNQTILLEDEKVNYVYFLLEGTVNQCAINFNGETLIINTFKQNAFFPMSPVLRNKNTKHFFVAADEVLVNVAPAQEVVAFLHDYPEVAMDLLTRVYIGLDGVLDKQIALMSGNAKYRIVTEIVIACRRFGVFQDGSYSIRVTEQAIADRTGLARETVSRELQKLKKDEFIHKSKGLITVPDLHKLIAS